MFVLQIDSMPAQQRRGYGTRPAIVVLSEIVHRYQRQDDQEDDEDRVGFDQAEAILGAIELAYHRDG